MNFKHILLITAAPLLLTACGNAKDDEAKRLGFSSVSEMEEIQSKGWHTNAQYRADETARAKRLGFVDMDELHEAEAAGIMDPVAFRKHKAEEDAADAQAEDKSDSAPPSAPAAQVEDDSGSDEYRAQAKQAATCFGWFSAAYGFSEKTNDSEGVKVWGTLGSASLDLLKTYSTKAQMSSQEVDILKSDAFAEFNAIAEKAYANRANQSDLSHYKRTKEDCMKFLDARSPK